MALRFRIVFLIWLSLAYYIPELNVRYFYASFLYETISEEALRTQKLSMDILIEDPGLVVR